MILNELGNCGNWNGLSSLRSVLSDCVHCEAMTVGQPTDAHLEVFPDAKLLGKFWRFAAVKVVAPSCTAR